MREKCPTLTIELIYGSFAPLARQLIGLQYKAAAKDLDGKNEEGKNRDKKECDRSNHGIFKGEVDNDNSNNVQQQYEVHPIRQEEQDLQQQPVQIVDAIDEAGEELDDDWCVVECRLSGSVGKNSIDDD